jgi:hypothetical protein
MSLLLIKRDVCTNISLARTLKLIKGSIPKLEALATLIEILR